MARFGTILLALVAGCSASGLPIVDGPSRGGPDLAIGASTDLAVHFDAALVNDLYGPDLARGDLTVSAAPCLTGGNLAYLDGDSADWIHPGAELIQVTKWFPRSTTDDDTFWYQAPVKPDGSGGWAFGFSTLQMGRPLAVGRYDNVQAIGSVSQGRAGLSISGSGRICDKIDGWFEIESVAGGPLNGTYTELTAMFEQHCSGLAGSLRGCIHFEN